MRFVVVDRLAVRGDDVAVGDHGDHAVDDVLGGLAGQDVLDVLDAMDSQDNWVVADNQGILVGMDSPVDVAVDVHVAVLDNQEAIAGFVDWVVDNRGNLHLAILAVDHVASGFADVVSHAVALDNHQATSDTTCLHPADSNDHSFISTCFTHNETDRFVVSQCPYTPNGIYVDSTETLLRIVDRQMSDRTRIHCAVMSKHT